MERTLLLALIVADGLLVALGQFFIKAGMLRISQTVTSPFSQIGAVILGMCRSPQIWAGLGISVVCFVLWAFVLTRAPLMVAIPLMNAVFYLAVVGASVWVLGDTVTPGKVIGIVMLLAAITILSREKM